MRWLTKIQAKVGVKSISKMSKKENEGDQQSNNFLSREPCVPSFDGKQFKFTLTAVTKPKEKAYIFWPQFYNRKQNLWAKNEYKIL